jgi:hypothetical protein
MALVLERTHPLQRDPAPHVDVRRGDVDTELDAERSTERELLLENPFGEHVDGVAGELLNAHGSGFGDVCLRDLVG